MNYAEVTEAARDACRRKGGKLSVLLVSPREFNQIFGGWNIPPIGPAYVSAALKQAGVRCHTLNLNSVHGEICEEIERAVKKWDVDLLGFGALISIWSQAGEVFRAAKRAKSGIITYLGGGGITCAPKECMDLVPEADLGMVGEGEITCRKLVEALERGTDLRAVSGMILRDSDGSLLFNKPREVIMDLDSLPWPDWEGFDFFPEDNAAKQAQFVTAPVVTSRGCPFNCTFCSKPSGRLYRPRNLDSIMAEIDYLVRHYGVNRLFLNDDLFAQPVQIADSDEKRSRLELFCERIAPYKLEWLIYLRVGDYLTDKVLSSMSESGCTEICYGIESGDNTVLRSMRKGITTKTIWDTVRRTCNSGIPIGANFIFGDSAETEETIENTFRFIDRISPYLSMIAFYPISLYPGSILYDRAVAEGKINNTTEFIRQGLPLVNMSRLDDSTYEVLVKETLPAKRAEVLTREEPRHRTSVLQWDSEKRLLFSEERCPRCGRVSKAYFKTDTLTDYSNHLCPFCGHTTPFLIIGHYTKLFDRFLLSTAGRGKLAIWGAGLVFRFYFAFSDVLKTMPFLLVDRSDFLLSHGVAGLKVLPPEQLKAEKIRQVLVTAGKYTPDIIGEIQSGFPDVEYIYDFRDVEALESFFDEMDIKEMQKV